MNRRRALMAVCESSTTLGLVDGTYTNPLNPSKWSLAVSSNTISQTNSYYNAVDAQCRILIPLTVDIDVSNGDTFGMILRDGTVLDGAGRGCAIYLADAAGNNILQFGTGYRPSKNTKYTGTATADTTAHYIKFKPVGDTLSGTKTFTFELYKGNERLF